MELNSKNVKKILLIILFGVVAFAAVQNLNYIARFIAKLIAVFNPVITALCIAFVLNVLLNALEKKVFKFICTENENSIDKTNRKIESKQI